MELGSLVLNVNVLELDKGGKEYFRVSFWTKITFLQKYTIGGLLTDVSMYTVV